MRLPLNKSRIASQSAGVTAIILFHAFFTNPALKAGPPYVTDDPEPVELRHWEIYFALAPARDSAGWTGASPLIELDYGAFSNTQISLIAPLAFSAPEDGANHAGFGDLQLSVKYRFLAESDWFPQVAVFPQINIPTGNHTRDLGAGETVAFFPVWLQKGFGKWTVSGGGGYWVNPGIGNRNWWFSGLLLQRTISERLTVGAEIYHETSSGQDIPSNTSFNVGAVLELNDHWDFLFSAGRSIVGPSDFQGYFAFRLKLGPEKGK